MHCKFSSDQSSERRSPAFESACHARLRTHRSECDYELLDYSYTPRCIELAKEMIQKIAVLPRKVCFAINEDFTVRVLGGYSLLVPAR